MRIDFYWHAYRYLPYEQVFARRELKALLGQEPIVGSSGLSIESVNDWKAHGYRLTYFSKVVGEYGSQVIPLQAILETATNGSMGTAPVLHRQSTRYSAHGLHEYRGKFNPQVVRAIGNMLGLQPGDWVLDPFCGSGTSLLEAAHCSWNAIGMDLNPLAIEIARAKIAAVHIPVTELSSETEVLKKRLLKRVRDKSFDRAFTKKEIQKIGGREWKIHLHGFEYLRKWFTESTLVQLCAIINEIGRLPSKGVQLILRMILSDILREVSLQDPGDLRIRRRKCPPINTPAIPLYLEAATRKIETIFRAREHLPDISTTQDALLGDSRYGSTIVRAHPRVKTEQQFAAAITSPPYATALPYIDTQRLSLVFLGLIGADEIGFTERSLIGTREITRGERSKIEQAMEKNSERLPVQCLLLCQELRESLDKNKDGFRRQNVPALIYKYFANMASTFREVCKLLRTGAPFALVVGRNRTYIGGQTFIIDTPRFLALLAEDNGFVVQEIIEMDTYQRFDVHQVNSIRSESLLVLRRR